MRRLPWMQIAAYALLALAVAATALAFALLHTWDSPQIPGAAPGYRYLALGYERPTGVDYSGVSSISMIRLQPLLPAGYGLGTAFPNQVQLGLKPRGTYTKIDAELVIGDYMQALHLHPLVGRLLTLEDQRVAAPVAILSQSDARRLFGHARNALGKQLFAQSGFELSVVGVLPNRFHGVLGGMGNGAARVWLPYTLLTPLMQGKWPKGPPKGDATKLMPFMGPAPLLSVPDSVSPAQLAVTLQRLRQTAHAPTIPKDVTALTVAGPYSPFPVIQQTLAHRIRLFLALAVATLGLAAVNVFVIRWLAYLRRRHVLRIERVLGARRGYLLKRFGWQALIVLLLMLIVTALLILLFTLALRHFASNDFLSAVLTFGKLAPSLIWLLPLIVVIVMLVQALPLAMLLVRERLDASRTMTVTRTDQRAGAALIVLEVVLAALMSSAAAWSLSYGWRSTHADLGFLDRPATLLTTQQSTDSMKKAESIKGTAFQLIVAKVLAATGAVAPGVPVGFGPAIESDAGFDFPQTVGAGKLVTSACVESATSGWLLATGARVLAGRNFDVNKTDPDQVMIDAQVAHVLFGSVRGALGHTIGLQSETKPAQVIGVVAPLYLHGAGKPPCPLVLEDMRLTPYKLMGNGSTLAVGKSLDGAGRARLRDRIDANLKQQGATLKVDAIRTTVQERDWLARQQIEQARVFALIALFAWAIALSGVAAHLRLFLAMRKRQSAIRSALGAGPLRLYREVVLGTLALAAAGVAAGAARGAVAGGAVRLPVRCAGRGFRRGHVDRAGRAAAGGVRGGAFPGASCRACRAGGESA